MNDRLDSLKKYLHIIQESYTEPTTVLLTDKEKVIRFLGSSFNNVNIPEGTSLEAINSRFVNECLRTKKAIKIEVDSERFGFPFIANHVPILENDEVIGLLITNTSTKKIETLRHMSDELAATVEEMTATAEAVGKVSESITEEVQRIAEKSDNIVNLVNSARKTIALVQDIAMKSQILGLNASIESARAGEYGKGFSVVANEIRTMADQSKLAAQEILDYLNTIQGEIGLNNKSIQEIASTSEEHMISIEELGNAFQHIAKTAEHLNEQAKS